MSYYRDLRDFIKALEDRDLLVRVKRQIDKDTEITNFTLVRLDATH
jgi:UbiD family decarboxylase